MTQTVLLMSRKLDQLTARRWLANPPADCVVRFGKATRSDKQNRKLWPMLQDLQRQIPGMRLRTLDDIKLQFLNALGVEMRFLPTLEGEGMFPVGLKSSTLTKLQFAGLIELLYAFGAKNDVVWSEPSTRDET
jgi:hypothetical protein